MFKCFRNIIILMETSVTPALFRETEQMLLSTYLLPLILLSLECGPVRVLFSTHCLRTSPCSEIHWLYRCPGLMHNRLENDELFQVFLHHHHKMNNSMSLLYDFSSPNNHFWRIVSSKLSWFGVYWSVPSLDFLDSLSVMCSNLSKEKS